MKVITVWQPWASLIAIGAKPYEFRERPYTAYVNPPRAGERIGIHAAQRPIRLAEVGSLLDRLDSNDPADTPCLVRDIAEPFLSRAYAWLVVEREAQARSRRSWSVTVSAATIAQDLCLDVLRLPHGAIVCTAVLGEPKRGDECGHEFGFANDSDRDETFNWGWPMLDVEPVTPPYPCRGSQGFWQYNGPLS
jgi:hypothetical protein